MRHMTGGDIHGRIFYNDRVSKMRKRIIVAGTAVVLTMIAYALFVFLRIKTQIDEVDRITQIFYEVYYLEDVNEVINKLGGNYSVSDRVPPIHGGTTYVNCKDRTVSTPIVAGDKYYQWRFGKTNTKVFIIISVVDGHVKDKWIQVYGL